MNNQRILLTIAYDGTKYAGWQRQQNALAVQQVVEDALMKLFNHPVVLTGASRTDAGVHALGQRATFDAVNLRIPLEKLPLVINGFLPIDVVITNAEIVPRDSNPRFDAKYKVYQYKIQNSPIPNPLTQRYTAFCAKPLAINDMQKAARFFIGRHDFTSFCATGGSAKTFTREIYACEIATPVPDTVVLTITGNGFLYNMVRIIAGTLLYVGLGKIPPSTIPDMILAKNRKQAGKTMPPQGLVLVKVGYAPFECVEDADS